MYVCVCVAVRAIARECVSVCWGGEESNSLIFEL
jgi:hypothetical protein